MDKKILNVYLGDLVHDYVGKGPFNFPLNIGYIASYALKYYQGNRKLKIKLFKSPNDMLNAINSDPPSIIGLSNYTWNINLNVQVLTQIKKKYPEIVCVMGGPDFNVFDAEQYLKDSSYLDYYVVNQGEAAFLELLHLFTNNQLPHQCGNIIEIDNVAYYSDKDNSAVVGDITKRMQVLDDIPSPYLTGLLDEFFDYDLLQPVIETNRGCPYSCTFCAWGDEWARKTKRYSYERAKAEIEYIAERTKLSQYLLIADANFGIYKSDRDLARVIQKTYKKTGYPHRLFAQWAKNTSATIVEIAAILKDQIKTMTIGYQSMDQDVLVKIGRKNISSKQFEVVKKELQKRNVKTHCDLIIALPGESKESYLAGLEVIFNQDIDVLFMQNCRMLGGTDLNTPEQRKEYNLKTKFRLLSNQYGKYGENIALDHEEIIVATDTMTENEMMSLRTVNWLIWFMWNWGYYLEILKFLKSLGINPIHVIMNIDERMSDSSSELGELYNELRREDKLELFDSAEELYDYYSENFEQLLRDGYQKINYEYTYKVIFNLKEKMDDLVFDVIRELIDKHFGLVTEELQDIIKDLKNFTASKWMRTDDYLDGISNKQLIKNYKYDILRWKDNNYMSELSSLSTEAPLQYSFYLDEEKSERIRQLQKENPYDNNKSFQFQKMMEYIKGPEDLFYTVAKI